MLAELPQRAPRYASDALQSCITEAHLTAWGTWDVWESAPVFDIQRLVGERNTHQLIETRQNVIMSGNCTGITRGLREQQRNGSYFLFGGLVVVSWRGCCLMGACRVNRTLTDRQTDTVGRGMAGESLCEGSGLKVHVLDVF